LTGHPCPVKKLAHPCASPYGSFRWLHRYGFMGPQKHKSRNKSNGKSKNNHNSKIKSPSPTAQPGEARRAFGNGASQWLASAASSPPLP